MDDEEDEGLEGFWSARLSRAATVTVFTADTRKKNELDLWSFARVSRYTRDTRDRNDYQNFHQYYR